MRTLALFLGLTSALLSLGQSQIRVDPDPSGGSFQALSLRCFEVTSLGQYTVFGNTSISADGYEIIGMGVGFSSSGILWTRHFGSAVLGQFGMDNILGTTVTSNADIVVVGAKATSNGLSDAVIARLSSVGDTLWTRVLSTAGEEFFRAVDEADDGSIYAVGNIRMSGGLQTFVTHFSATGACISSRVETESFGNKTPEHIVARGDSLIIFEQQSFATTTDFVVRVLDASGTEVRYKRFGDSVLSENIPNVSEKNDGGFVIYAGFSPALSNPKTGVIFLDANLNVSYGQSRLIGSPGKSLFAFSVLSDPSGDAYLGGSVTSAPINYPVVMRFSGGSVSWTKTLGSFSAVTAPMRFENGNILVPSYGRSADNLSYGVTLSFLDQATGENLGFVCEENPPDFSVGVEDYENLFETEISPVLWVNPDFEFSAKIPFAPFTAYESVCGMTTLAMELLSFSAELSPYGVSLNWETASEQHSSYFTIERSADGVSFEDIVQISASGYSGSTIAYKTTDPNPLEGLSYYRLRETDLDGTISFSKVVSLEVAKEKGEVYRVFDVISTSEETSLFDLSGAVVQSRARLHRLEKAGIFILGDEIRRRRILVVD